MPDKERIKRVSIYAAKCVTGVIIVSLLSWLIGYKDTVWVLISVMLVLSPDGSDAVTLAVTRIKANLIGALSGFLLFVIHLHLALNIGIVVVMSIAVMITVVLCNLLKLEAATRTALAATIIVMTHEAGLHVWDTAIERVVSVVAGCLLGLVITFIFHNKFTQKTVSQSDLHQEA
ncbi:fusaric acid resistance family protein [Chitinophaga dinghuensis]|uniref:Fusaric acid resistance family protein n=1 Tax=Chitinophaga dinghuensis TaxID=1539050 RepID=A0A327VT96_9BACT|nr:FUSC family protein [Chitinophaga dinghuensis]RAJ79281.1 fusaric acid resistance family protein [Chitinophaga dinghuensis]